MSELTKQDQLSKIETARNALADLEGIPIQFSAHDLIRLLTQVLELTEKEIKQ